MLVRCMARGQRRVHGVVDLPQILTCLLTEQRVVFFSSSWALLPLVAECFLAYLHPLQWQHTFVPVLSRQMLDFVMAPTSFLMGCHLDYFEEVSKVRPWPFAVECQILVTLQGLAGGASKGPCREGHAPRPQEEGGHSRPWGSCSGLHARGVLSCVCTVLLRSSRCVRGRGVLGTRIPCHVPLPLNSRGSSEEWVSALMEPANRPGRGCFLVLWPRVRCQPLLSLSLLGSEVGMSSWAGLCVGTTPHLPAQGRGLADCSSQCPGPDLVFLWLSFCCSVMLWTLLEDARPRSVSPTALVGA